MSPAAPPVVIYCGHYQCGPTEDAITNEKALWVYDDRNVARLDGTSIEIKLDPDSLTFTVIWRDKVQATYNTLPDAADEVGALLKRIRDAGVQP